MYWRCPSTIYKLNNIGFSFSKIVLANSNIKHYNIIMNTLSFTWDANKAKSNLAKHGVSFEEAQSAFDDLFARLIPDPDHSKEEERFILLGLSITGNELVVSHCYRDNATTIRLISARKATKNEANEYWRFRK